MKRCSICLEEKEPHLFSFSSGAKDKLHPYCKPCANKRNRDKYYPKRKATRKAPALSASEKALVAALRRKQRKERPEHFKVYAARWRKNNPAATKEYARNKRARRVTAIGNDKISRDEWSRLKKCLGPRCSYCGEVAPLTMDHVQPLSRGGRHVISNILTSCRTCNSIKTYLSLNEFMERNFERTSYYRGNSVSIIQARSKAFPQQCWNGVGWEGDSIFQAVNC